MRNTLRVQRAIREISQEELAVAMSVSRQTINAIEVKKYVPSGLLCLRLAKYFNMTVEELFIMEEEDL